MSDLDRDVKASEIRFGVRESEAYCTDQLATASQDGLDQWFYFCGILGFLVIFNMVFSPPSLNRSKKFIFENTIFCRLRGDSSNFQKILTEIFLCGSFLRSQISSFLEKGFFRPSKNLKLEPLVWMYEKQRSALACVWPTQRPTWNRMKPITAMLREFSK